MKEHQGILAHIPFFGKGRKTNGSAPETQSVRQKRNFLLNVVSDVESRVFSKKVDVRKNETLLHAIQEEHKEIVPKRDISLKRYREVDEELSSLLKKIAGFKEKRTVLSERLESAQKKKREFAIRLPALVDEATLEAERNTLKESCTEKEKERTAASFLLGELEMDNETLSHLKEELEKTHQETSEKKITTLEKRETLQSKKNEKENKLQMIEQLTADLDQENRAANELLGSESDRKAKDESLRDEVENLKLQKTGVTEKLTHYEQEERTLKDQNRDTLETVKKIKGIKETLRVTLLEKEDKTKSLIEIQERLTLVGGEEGSLETKLKEIKDQNASFVTKKTALEERTKSILESLDTFSQMEEETAEEKERLNDLSKTLVSTKETIRIKELEIQSFKDALEEILTHV